MAKKFFGPLVLSSWTEPGDETPPGLGTGQGGINPPSPGNGGNGGNAALGPTTYDSWAGSFGADLDLSLIHI